jgi:hypothetical protein
VSGANWNVRIVTVAALGRGVGDSDTAMDSASSIRIVTFDAWMK